MVRYQRNILVKSSEKQVVFPIRNLNLFNDLLVIQNLKEVPHRVVLLEQLDQLENIVFTDLIVSTEIVYVENEL